MQYLFPVGVFGIVLDDKDRVLLVHRNDYDLWNLPGGKLEKGEDPWVGVVREVKEETGFDVEVIKLHGVYTQYEKDDIVFSFVCKITGGKLRINGEASEIKYFAVKDIPPNTSPNQVERIKDYFNNRDLLIMKRQNGKSSIELLKELSLLPS